MNKIAHADLPPRLTPGLEEALLILMTRRYAKDDASQQDRCLTIVSGSSQDWIDLAPLSEVALRLLALFEYDTNLVNGQLLAKLTKRLIDAEVTPGGPYADSDEEPDIFTNAAIAQLFSSLGAPLPNLRSYLEAQVHSIEHIPVAECSWVLLWPHTIATYPREVTSYLLKQLPVEAQMDTLMTRNSVSTSSFHALPSSAETIRRDIAQLPEALRKPALIFWQSIVSADKYNEISSLTSAFTASLSSGSPSGSALDSSLDQANFYTWMAYTIYDDFVDEEGDPSALPLANIFHRRAFALFRDYTTSRSTRKLISRQFDRMDEANVWEVTHCRFIVRHDVITIQQLPRYGNRSLLARRAGVHGLGPLLALSRSSLYSPRQMRHVTAYLSNYLIARQLNDDLHDWKDDLRRGHASYVVTFLLRGSRIKPGAYAIEQLIATLQKYFWQTGLERLHAMILRHANNALTRAKTSQLFKDDSPFVAMTVLPIIESVHASRAIVKNKKEYLDIYTSSA